MPGHGRYITPYRSNPFSQSVGIRPSLYEIRVASRSLSDDLVVSTLHEAAFSVSVHAVCLSKTNNPQTIFRHLWAESSKRDLEILDLSFWQGSIP